MRLLLIEDDDILGEGLRDYLRAEGHAVDWFRDLRQADAVRGEPFDAWLLDWQLPDGSGLDWLRARRAKGETTPALMLTARDRLSDRVIGLDGGADDYLIKPFAPEELAARLRAVCRRSAGAADGRVRAGGVWIDIQARGAFRDGQRIELTAREWALLEALALRTGRIVLKGELERLVHGSDAEIASNALEVHISSLRKKLGRDVISTVRGLGYRLDEGGTAA
ncbi:MAG TPA: response regulator transcription factor [Burkholderiaceae bacterium]|nr:response regulator transcription factor [Burkholderiaceae bacterium]